MQSMRGNCDGHSNLDFRSGSARHKFGDFTQVDAAGQIHFPRMDLENVETGFFVGRRKLDFAVNTTRPQQRRVQDVDSVSCHDHLPSTTKVTQIDAIDEEGEGEGYERAHLNVFSGFETVQLVQQFQHGTLNLRVSAAARLDTRRTDRINLVHEYNRRRVFPKINGMLHVLNMAAKGARRAQRESKLPGHDEKLANHTRTFTDEFLHQFRPGNSNERAVRVVSNSAS